MPFPRHLRNYVFQRNLHYSKTSFFTCFCTSVIIYCRISVSNFASTSSILASDAFSMKAICRLLQSSVRIWSTRIAPTISFPSIATSKMYPLLCEVMGQKSARLLILLYASGEMTIAGRRPLCSCPLVGSKSIHTISPRRGVCFIATIPHCHAHVPNQPLYVESSCQNP